MVVGLFVGDNFIGGSTRICRADQYFNIVQAQAGPVVFSLHCVYGNIYTLDCGKLDM